jgi:hypothetical protein
MPEDLLRRAVLNSSDEGCGAHQAYWWHGRTCIGHRRIRTLSEASIVSHVVVAVHGSLD